VRALIGCHKQVERALKGALSKLSASLKVGLRIRSIVVSLVLNQISTMFP
jgi:hypothetical protein